MTTRGNKALARGFIIVALKGIIMETEHAETVVDKAVAYVKDFFGVPPGDRTPDVEANPEYTDTAPEPTIEGAMRLDPHTRTLKIGSEINADRAPRADESANSPESAESVHEHPMDSRRRSGLRRAASADPRRPRATARGDGYRRRPFRLPSRHPPDKRQGGETRRGAFLGPLTPRARRRGHE